jgi:Uma2 family endonuclease
MMTEATAFAAIVGSIGRFTIEEYERMSDRDVLGENRAEVIEGVNDDVPAVKPPPASIVQPLWWQFTRSIDERFRVRECPLRLGDRSQPEPDLGIIWSSPDNSTRAHPPARDVALVSHVADTSDAEDRELKLPLSATAGIPKVWIVNLLERRIAVYRRPAGGRYAESWVVGEGEAVAPAAFPNLAVAVLTGAQA